MTNVSPWIVRPPTVAVATPSTGFSRTVTVELLLMRFPSVFARYTRVPRADTNGQCYEKTTTSGNPAILPRGKVRVKPDLPHQSDPADAGDSDSATLTPAVTRSGFEAHTVPPL